MWSFTLMALHWEKILNILNRKSIRVWDLEKNNKGVRFKISYDDYIKHSDLINEIMKPVNKKGFMIKLNKLKFRRGFSMGLLNFNSVPVPAYFYDMGD